MQYVSRSRRFFACLSSEHFCAGTASFTTSPQFGQKRTGALARPGEGNVILEAFKPGTVPTGRSQVLEGIGASAPATGTGGLY